MQSGSLALDILRMDFAHFDPLLCVALNLSEEVPRDPCCETQTLVSSWNYSGSFPGWLKYSHHPDEEYAVAAALFSLAGVADDVSTTAIQALIEGAWAEGMDRKGAERYGGKLVGKTGEHACIGASEVLVALWHKRCNAFMIQFTGSQEKEVLDYEGIPTVYLDYENQPVMALRRMVSNLFDPRQLHNHGGRRWVGLPMFLQINGRSCLVVGVATRIERALLVADPIDGGIRVMRDEEMCRGSFQLIVLQGRGPSEGFTLSSILEAAGQTDGAATLSPAASFYIQDDEEWSRWSISDAFPKKHLLSSMLGTDASRYL